MLTCILGGCGTGKSTVLMQQLRQKLQSGQKAIVLVPEQFSFEEEKKLYDFLGGVLFNQLKTYSFATLSRNILEICGGRSGGYASEQEKLLYLYETVQKCAALKELHAFERRSASPEFIQSLASVVTKIRKAGVSSELLLQKAQTIPDKLGEKMQDFAKILLFYDKILTEHHRSDNLVSLTEAAAAANIHEFFKGMHVFIDEFDSFTGDQYQMLEIILSQAEDVTAAIRADHPNGRPSGIFLGGNQTYYQLQQLNDSPGKLIYCDTYRRSRQKDLTAVSVQTLRRRIRPAPYCGNVHILEAADPTAEIEYICAECCRLLQECPGLQCRDIAIAVKEPEVYFPLLERAMKRYALPFDLAAPKSVLHTELVRHLLTLLEILSQEKWDTELLLRYMKSAFSHYAAEETAYMEHYCFQWSIAESDWDVPFYAEDDEILQKRAEPFGGQTLEHTRQTLIQEMQTLRAACQEKDVRTVCTALYQHLLEKKELFLLEKETARTEFIMVWNLLADILDTIVKCSGSQVLPIQALREQFLLLLQASTFSTPPQTLNSICIVNARTARLNSPRIVFVPGVTDTQFPADVSDSGMFSQQELRTLEDCDIKLARLFPELYSDELLVISKTLSSASEQLYLLYPRLNAAHAVCSPALLTQEIRNMFPADAPVFFSDRQLPLRFYVRTMESAYFHYVRNIRTNSPELSALRRLLETKEPYRSRIRKLDRSQDKPALTPSPASMQQLLRLPLTLSPSEIETFHICPFQYFCQYALRLYVPERVVLSPMSAGDYAHYCLEMILKDMQSIDEFLSMSPEMLRQKIHTLSAQFSQHHFPDAVRRNGRFQFNYRVAGNSLLDLLLHMQADFRKEPFRPVGYEVAFKEHPDFRKGELPAFRLRDGQILCRGKIDRIDRWDAETAQFLRVVDYKTGTKTLEPEKLAAGLDMQMLIYLFALRQNPDYASAVPSGVLYLPSGQPKPAAYQERSTSVSTREEILDAFYQRKGLVLDTVVDQMDAELRQAFKPVSKYTKDDHLFRVTRKQMQNLEAHVKQNIGQMGDRLYSGLVAPEPYLHGDFSPCERCSFADLCGSAEKNTKPLSQNEKKAAVEAVFDPNPDEEVNPDAVDEGTE